MGEMHSMGIRLHGMWTRENEEVEPCPQGAHSLSLFPSSQHVHSQCQCQSSCLHSCHGSPTLTVRSLGAKSVSFLFTQCLKHLPSYLIFL